MEAPAIASKTCDNAFKGRITNYMTCFGTHDLCEIPHGAPVNCGGELQGVFSYDSRTLCGLNDGGFGVFAKVCEFTDWTTETTAS